MKTPNTEKTNQDLPRLQKRAATSAATFAAICLPLIGKRPAEKSSWSSYTAPGVYGSHTAWERATGYALAPAPGSDLVLIDFDDEDFRELVCKELPQLQRSPGSRRGPNEHRYVQLAYPLPKATISRRNSSRKELGSLRGPGAYVVGPGSIHPSGDTYTPIEGELATLNEKDTKQLIELFGEHNEDAQPHLANAPFGASNATKDAITKALIKSGYKHTNHPWINGSCIFADTHHKGGQDVRPSAGFNTQTGIYNCFACGKHTLSAVHLQLGLGHAPQSSSERPIYSGTLQRTPGLPTEINVACELIRRDLPAALQLHNILWGWTRNNHGKNFFNPAQITELCSKHGLRRREINDCIAQALKAGVINQTRGGNYVLVGIKRLKRRLGLDPAHYASTELPSSSVRSAYKLKKQTFLHACYFLPRDGLSSAQRAHCLGVSKRTLYRYENALGIRRKTKLKTLPREGGEPGAHFLGLKTKEGTPLGTHNPDRLVSALQCIGEGSLGYYRQLPSTRILPANPHT